MSLTTPGTRAERSPLRAAPGRPATTELPKRRQLRRAGFSEASLLPTHIANLYKLLAARPPGHRSPPLGLANAPQRRGPQIPQARPQCLERAPNGDQIAIRRRLLSIGNGRRPPPPGPMQPAGN